MRRSFADFSRSENPVNRWPLLRHSSSLATLSPRRVTTRSLRTFHRRCFRCRVCGLQLTLRTFRWDQGRAQLPLPEAQGHGDKIDTSSGNVHFHPTERTHGGGQALGPTLTTNLVNSPKGQSRPNQQCQGIRLFQTSGVS